MANLGSLTYDLVANVERFERGLTRAERLAQKRSRAISNTFRSIGVAIAGISIGNLVSNVIKTADNLDKLSIKLGISVEALSQLKFAADLSGLSFEQFTMAIQRSTRRIAEAAEGTGEAQNALKELGLNASELNRMSPDRQLESIADAFGRVENSADRLRLAFKLFDSEGVKMLQVLERGGEGLREMRAEADRLGVTMSRGAVDQMVMFKDTMTRLSAVTQGLAQSLVITLGPAFERAIKFIKDATEALGFFLEKFGFWKANIDRLGTDAAYARMDLIRQKIADINAEIAADPQPPSMFQIGELKALGEEYGRLQARINEINNPVVTGAGATPGLGAPMETDVAAREREAMEAKLERLREGLMSERELLLNHTNEKLALVEELENAGIISEQERFQLVEDLTAQHHNKLVDMAQQAARNKAIIDKQELDQKKSNFRSTLSAAATHNKALFQINKAYAIAEGLLSMRKTILEAYEFGTSVGGPAVGAAFAAIAGAAQAANIAAIASTSFGGSGGGAGSSGGGAVPVASADENFGFARTDDSRQSTASTTVTINLGGAKVFSDEAIRELIEAINDQIDDGVNVKGIVVA